MGEGSPYRTIGLSAAQRASIGHGEVARLDALCRHHVVPLNTWLGGALRSRILIAITMPLDAVVAVRRYEQENFADLSPDELAEKFRLAWSV